MPELLEMNQTLNLRLSLQEAKKNSKFVTSLFHEQVTFCSNDETEPSPLSNGQRQCENAHSVLASPSSAL